MNYFTLLAVPVLSHILYTDFSRRRVSTIALTLYFCISLIRLIFSLTSDEIVYFIVINFLLLSISGISIYIYSLIRRKSMKYLVGLGDVLFVIIAALNFAPYSFLIFISTSSIAGIIFFVVRMKFKKNEMQIPFAGIMACLMILLFILEQFNGYSSYNDSTLINLLY